MRSRRRTIIITGLLAVLISYIVMNPVEEEKPGFSLYIGDEAEKIELTNDWESTKKTILDKLQPLWDNLDTGDSKTFYIELVEDTAPGWLDKNDYRDKGKVSYTSTTTYSKYRFFVDRRSSVGGKPQNGCERVFEDDETAPFIEGKGQKMEWSSIERSLRDQLDLVGEDLTL